MKTIDATQFLSILAFVTGESTFPIKNVVEMRNLVQRHMDADNTLTQEIP